MLSAMKPALSEDLRMLRVSLCLYSSLLLITHCFAEDNPWQTLRQLKPGLSFVFMERDLTCVYGELKKVSDTDVSIKTKQGSVVIPKADLLRVRSGFDGRFVANDNPNLPLFTFYSGRSSWADLLAFAPFQSKRNAYSKLRFSLTTTDGHLHEGTLTEVTAEAITLTDKLGTTATFSKGTVSRADYIREKPLSDTQEFYWEELGMGMILDPQLYPRLFHLGDTMRVTLYQSTLVEDNSVVECK